MKAESKLNLKRRTERTLNLSFFFFSFFSLCSLLVSHTFSDVFGHVRRE